MAVNTLSESLDNLYTTTWQNMKSEVIDNIFDATPFWFWLRDKGKLRTEEGGRFITEPLSYAKSDRVAFIGKGGTVVLDEGEFLTIAKYDWKYLVDSIVRFGVDDQQNRGKNKIISFMDQKLVNSQDSLIEKIEETLFGTNASDTLAFLGLQNLIADAPGSATVAGIADGTYTWWQNKQTTMTGLSFAVYGVSKMRTMLNTISNNKGSARSDIIVTGQTPFEYYEDSVTEQKRIVNQKLGDAGFENIQFKSVPMIWSSECANTRMYFLNTKHLWFVYDPMMFFDMTEWKPIPDQVNDKAAQIVTAGELITNRRRAHGVLHTIDTA